MAANVIEWAKPILVEKFTGANSARLTGSVCASVMAMTAVKVLAPGKEVAKEVEETSKNRTMVEVKTPTMKKEKEKSQQKVAVDRNFFRHFVKLLKIAAPELHGRQGAYLGILTVLLLLRTALSLKISEVTGLIAKRMVQTEAKPLMFAILQLAMWSVPSSLVNSGLKYLTNLLEITFRRHLTRHFHRKYLSQQNFFKCVGLNAVDSVEQRIAQDVQRFASGASSIYSSLFKPMIDIAVFAKKVSDHGGWKGPTMIIAYYSVITFLIRALAPNFGLLTAVQQNKEGKLRKEHTKLIQYAEEVTLSQGENSTLSILNRLFRTSHLHYLYTAYMKAKNNVLDGILVKYGSVMVGYGVCGMSIFSEEAMKMDSSELTGLYIHTSTLLVNLARAIGQLIMTYKTVASLAGYTHRVYQLEEGLVKVERQVKEQQKEKAQKAAGSEDGVVMSGSTGIRFSQVPVISPDKTTLVKSLSFHVDPGMNLLIVGPNGCGKSSTFRLLGELWPLYGGKIEKPSFEHLYYVPQRPYMSSGTLRDQVIYPTDAKELKVGDNKLYECLEMASLEGLLQQPGISWEARQNWAGEALSQGQKQKLAMARLFFHRPRFAILDECSSAIDLDIEQQLYTHCKTLGISLITIAHRRSLWKYHNWVLRFDGNGGYMFSPLEFDEGDEMVLSKVIHSSDPSQIGERIVISLHHSKDEVDASDAHEETVVSIAEAQEKERQKKEDDRLAAERREALHREAEHAEADHKKAARKEAERKEREEAERKKREAEHQEAERLKAERLAAEKNKNAREEAEREAEEAERIKREEAEAEAKKKETVAEAQKPAQQEQAQEPQSPEAEEPGTPEAEERDPEAEESRPSGGGKRRRNKNRNRNQHQ